MQSQYTTAQLQSLNAEMRTGTRAANYSTNIAAGNIGALTSQLNATLTGATAINPVSVSQRQFVNYVAPFLGSALASSHAAIYQLLWSAIVALPQIFLSDNSTVLFFDQAVADGLKDPNNNAINPNAFAYTPSVAESVLSLPGTVVAPQDVVAALAEGN